ncbi:hypothetical protein [Terrabacter lapilli]|uniref:hypothetical protein n=1 Tax=Terrabacter lapilli TaxID=436231 RepID=UPI0031D9E229
MGSQAIVTVDGAFAMAKLVEVLAGACAESPAKDAEAVAEPAATLSVYETVSGCSKPPAEVTFAVHGVNAAPV